LVKLNWNNNWKCVIYDVKLFVHFSIHTNNKVKIMKTNYCIILFY
jgi:hypothetical protein